MADGVPQHVLDDAGEVVVVNDAARAEPVAEEVSLSFVLAVELLGVDAVDAVEPARECRLCRLDHEVVVVAEQREGMHLPSVCVDGVAQEPEEREPVAGVAEDRAAVDALDPDVEDPVGEPASKRSRHGRPR